LRRQAESAWFRSWVQYDPKQIVKKVKQPVLVVSPALDRQFPPDQSNQLEALARARKGAVTEKVIVPGVNHLLVPATTGEEDEYASLSGTTISPVVPSTISAWLKTAMEKKK